MSQESKHEWDEDILKVFGNARCRRCGMQHEYFERNLKTLRDWKDEDKVNEADHYQNCINMILVCKGRI